MGNYSYENLSTQQKTYSDFLSGKAWDYFSTLTFQEERTAIGAYQAVKRSIENNRLSAFFAVERGELYGRVHAHALINCIHGLPTIEHLREQWQGQYGFIQLRPYRKTDSGVRSESKPRRFRECCTIKDGQRFLHFRVEQDVQKAGGAIPYVCKYILKNCDYYDFINLRQF